MIRTTLMLSPIVVMAFVLPVSAATYVGNMAEGTAILRVNYERNEDGTFTSLIDINPNVGEDRITFLQLTIQGDLYQSLATDPTAIAIIGGANVNYTSQRNIVEILDANYDAMNDTVVDDTLYSTVFDLVLTPDDGTQIMSTDLASKYGTVGGTVPGSIFSPLARVTTLGTELQIFGSMQYINNKPANPFAVSLLLPEPTSALLVIIGVLTVIASARRQRRQTA